MHKERIGHPRLERMLAHMLHYGTWLSCGVIALGVALMAANKNALGGKGLVRATISSLLALLC